METRKKLVKRVNLEPRINFCTKWQAIASIIILAAMLLILIGVSCQQVDMYKFNESENCNNENTTSFSSRPPLKWGVISQMLDKNYFYYSECPTISGPSWTSAISNIQKEN